METKEKIVKGFVDFPLIVGPHTYSVMEKAGLVKNGMFTPKGNKLFPKAKRSTPHPKKEEVGE